MSLSDLLQERLLRRLDGNLPTSERTEIDELLRNSPEAREFVRDVAEQAVAVADLERANMSRREAAIVARPLSAPAPDRRRQWLRRYAWHTATVALIVSLVAVSAFAFLPVRKSGIARVSKLTGSNNYFGASGKIDNGLSTGAVVSVGDTLETRSCDAWIELKASDGATMTIAGHSTLRVLQPAKGELRFELMSGSLWVNPAPTRGSASIVIQTPSAQVEAQDAQLDVQASATEMVVRVNRGAAHVESASSGHSVDVSSDQQLTVALGSRQPLSAIPQPKPINSWSCNLAEAPEVILGNWLPPLVDEQARLGAVPLLWPLGEGKQIVLYAVAFAAWKNSEHPVLLHADSHLRFRGRTQQAHKVRFGFSAQKMRGVFAGKFEVDVEPTELGPAGQAWQVDLPLANFRALYPQLAESPEGLELTDVYALTVETDAGLEIHDIELLPGGAVP